MVLQLREPLGSYVIENAMLKAVPSAMYGQSGAECAFLFHPQLKGRWDEVERITVHVHAGVKRIMDREGPLRNPADRGQNGALTLAAIDSLERQRPLAAERGDHLRRAFPAAAQAAFPGWAAQTSVARGRILSKASQLIEARKAELAELLTREEGKTLAEATGEVQRTADIFRFFDSAMR